MRQQSNVENGQLKSSAITVHHGSVQIGEVKDDAHGVTRATVVASDLHWRWAQLGSLYQQHSSCLLMHSCSEWSASRGVGVSILVHTYGINQLPEQTHFNGLFTTLGTHKNNWIWACNHLFFIFLPFFSLPENGLTNFTKDTVLHVHLNKKIIN